MLMGSGYGKFPDKIPVCGGNERDPDKISCFPIFYRTLTAMDPNLEIDSHLDPDPVPVGSALVR